MVFTYGTGLKSILSEVVNVKITNYNLREYHLPNPSLTYAAFFRYFIPKFVTEDKVLNLDSERWMKNDGIFEKIRQFFRCKSFR